MKPRYSLLTAAASAIMVTATVGFVLPAVTAADAVPAGAQLLAGAPAGTMQPLPALPAAISAVAAKASSTPHGKPPAASRAEPMASSDALAEAPAISAGDFGPVTAIAVPLVARGQVQDGWRAADRSLALTLETRFETGFGIFAAGRTAPAAAAPAGPDKSAAPSTPVVSAPEPTANQPASNDGLGYVPVAEADDEPAAVLGSADLDRRPAMAAFSAVPAAAQVSAVPDSATWLMVVAGLGLIGLNLRRSHLPNVAS